MQWQRQRWPPQPQAQGRLGHQKLRRQEGPSTWAPGLSRRPDLRLPAPELGGGQRALSEADPSVWTFVMAAPGITRLLCVLSIDGGLMRGQVSSAGELGWGPRVRGLRVLRVPLPGHELHPQTSGSSGGRGLGRPTSRLGRSRDERWLTGPRLLHESQIMFA